MEVSPNSLDPAALRRWLAATPPGAAVLLSAEQAHAVAGPSLETPAPVAGTAPPRCDPTPWRERLWTVPAETLLTSAEAADALGLTRDAIHRRTAKKRPAGLTALPHRRMDGVLVFRAGDLREWVEQFGERAPLPRTSLDRPRRTTAPARR